MNLINPRCETSWRWLHKKLMTDGPAIGVKVGEVGCWSLP